MRRKGATTTAAWIVAFAAIFLMSTLGRAEVPLSITYQGILKDENGYPVNNDNVTLSFSFWTSQDGGGDEGPLWSESQSGVSVVDGVFNVILGQPGNSLPPDIFDDAIYLEVEVNGEPLAPRQPVMATPFALKAAVAERVQDGSVTAVMIADDAVTGDKIGAGEVGLLHIGLDAVDSSRIEDRSVSIDDLADAAVGVGKLAPDVFAAMDDAYVNQAGDAMSGALSLPGNGLTVGVDQLALFNGNVGIGLSNPSSRLHVAGQSRLAPTQYQYAQLGLNGGDLQLYLYDGSNASPTITMGSGAGTATIETNGNMGLNIEAQGNKPISIRTENTEQTGLVDRITVEGGKDTATVAILNSNVGVGTAIPAAKLDVAGNVNVSGNLSLGGAMLASVPPLNYSQGGSVTVLDGAGVVNVLSETITIPAAGSVLVMVSGVTQPNGQGNDDFVVVVIGASSSPSSVSGNSAFHVAFPIAANFSDMGLITFASGGQKTIHLNAQVTYATTAGAGLNVLSPKLACIYVPSLSP